jgi:hypothetical protein
MNNLSDPTFQRAPTDRDLEQLMYPAQVFEHPRDVADDPHLTLQEKRAILASWASDACAVEAAPALRRPPGSPSAITIDEILETLCALDGEAGETDAPHRRAQPPDPAPRSAAIRASASSAPASRQL